MRVRTRVAMAGALVVLALIAVQPFTATSQTIGTLQPGFGQTIAALHRAESAGATSSEIAELVALLNRALELNGEALKMSTPDQTQKQADLLGQVNQILTTVQNRAAQLTALASHRSYTNRILTYVSGAVAAILGTIVYAFAVSFYQKYRIKRTFQMRVTRK
jgi:N-acyl-D-aspartate/D-glutamate deacylase